MGDSRVRCSRLDTGDRCEFRIANIPNELSNAVRRSAFQEHNGYWIRSFPADVPHLDRAWENFERLIVPWLRQSAGLDPVPWRSALEEACRSLNAGGVDWWLTGSGALAVRGMEITPGDLDLVVSADDAQRVGDLLLDGLVEPVARTDWFCDWWGRAILGARVEWVGGVGPTADLPKVTDFGPEAASRLETIRWRGWEIRVPPLDLQRTVSVRRGLHNRVRLIDAGESSHGRDG